jgi:hypothetical protein
MLHPAKTPTAEDLRKNILSTYFYLRVGIAAMSAALPIALLAYSFINHGVLEEHSISAFYGAYGGAMRNWFVGTLCALGAFLILYKGFSFAENWALNVAGLFAILTAFKPCDCWQPNIAGSRLHNGFAITCFAAMAFVCFFCTKVTISLLPDKATQDKFRRKYFGIGAALLLSPAIAVILSYRHQGTFVFIFEAIAVWVFAYYWFTKTQEYQITSAEKRALKGELQYVGKTLAPAPPAVAPQR